MTRPKLLASFETFDITPEKLKESRDANDGKIVLRGILQKADTLNQNGRIYPKDILEREVRNYQKFIIENRALGECVPPGTEIYTRDGWKNIENISEDEFVYTLKVDTNELQLQRIKQKIVLPFDGELLRFKNAGSYDMCLTPNHRVLMWNRNNVPVTMTASELYKAYENKNSAVSHSGLRRVDIPRNGKTPKFSNDKVTNTLFDFRFMQVEKIPYKGDVFCVNVQNGTWLMRYNDKVCWTHNCDHPESSVINLKNVSHIIREAFFEGNTVMGVVELLNTPSGKVLQSLVESGVKLGISSRGVGSTKKQGDYYTVQEDFQLICWDFVSEPSTPGAFMLAEGKDISDEDLRKVFNKSDRIDRILNDILFVTKGEKK